MFECNLCSFGSGLGDSIWEHMIDHVLPQRHDHPEMVSEGAAKTPYKHLLGIWGQKKIRRKKCNWMAHRHIDNQGHCSS